ncbi:protocadherin Fat 1a isoform X4 [Narcine bancroftii]|uniref:protocadherin Fat 1a isoform X4 n=1 Tax=Narcine bancroftii TaxID=1343680 RepID=UPI003831B031
MMRSTALLVSLLLFQLLNSCEGNRKKESASSIKFTQHLYNAYIYENSAAKTYLESHPKMGIYITHPASEFRYKIISGDHENLFKAEDYSLGDFCFLRIRTKGGNSAVLNREVKDHYLLNVKAVERKTNTETQTKVKVHVLDTNDLRPLFSPTSYSVSLAENTPLRTSVARVRATDADIGTNGEFYYSFKDWTGTFAIHPTNGVVTLTGRLSYSETKRYDLEILAADRGKKLYGSSGTSSLAKLTVHVEPGNENTPVITAVTLVPSDMDDDPTYAIVTVEDEDPGDNGEIASLNIVAGDPLHQFRAMRSSAGSKEYHIKAVDQIYWESQSTGYNLTLQARDKGNPPQFSSVKVIHVTAPQSKTLPCRFEKAVYKARLNEFAPLNTPVVMVTANPMYPHIKFAFRYHVDKFRINPDTGLITTNDLVKAQEASSYELEVLLVNRQASTKVIVYIIDMNDNTPEFKQSSYKSSVSENVPVGTSVLTVSATDVDTGENGYVTYSIANLNPHPFVIDYFSGVIRTSEELDYELMPRIYNLRVRASDWGSPYRREVEALVTIFLSNVNDNKPLFEKVNCIGTIPRDLNIGEQLTTVSAIDADEMQLVRYQIVTGNELDLFDLNPNSGVLLLKRPLTDGSGVKGSFHYLQITATDGENFATPMYINITVQTSSKQVNLHCTETGVAKFLAEKLLQANKIHNRGDSEDLFSDNHSINRHAPQFDSSFPGVIKVKEDTPVGTKLLFVNATDFDTGFNGKLVHVISGGDSDSKFIVDMETGWLKVFSLLDREKKDHYTLNVTVYDLGIPQKSAWRLLDVNILDANDNRPVFLQNMYSEVVSENKEVGSKIIQLEATDRDLGANGEVRYSILTDTDMFAIDSLTGIVKVIGLLDREKEPVYSLKVEARDQAKEDQQLFSTVLLKVTLEDDNDNAPEFIPQNYHVKIREDLPEGTVAMWLEAYDPDVGQSSQVRYSLIDSGEGYFDVDKLSGALRLVHRLDFEKKQFYNLTARAKDKGRPISLSSTCHIQVEVVDVNENLYAPVFPFFAANGSVSEDVPVGTSVMTITAHDNDSGRDGEVRYSIRDGSGLGVFTIDEEKGIIKTAELLDHETTSHYWLTVYATDLGVVPLFSFVEVYIEIRDINDNAPQTSEPVYYPDVMENSPEGVSVVQIEATDPDSSSFNRLSYKITSGNPQGFFVINQETGLITTTSRKLDRERQAEHILEVTITDNDSNPKSTVARVIVKVLDENDNKPQFLQKFYKIKLPERIKPDREKFVKREPIFRVIAADRDEGPNAEISYSIEEGDEQGKFFIEPKTGVVSSKKFSAAGEYDILTIKVVDNGRPQKSSTARLHVEWIVKPKPPPVPWNFEEPSYSFSVMESDPITHMVGVIAVEPVGTTLWFDITGGNYDSRFDVDKGSGTIIVAKLLDAEQKSNYNLTVEATDGTSSISTQVYIKVIDTNDHRPEFSKPKYEVSIPEDTIPKTVILQVSARDEDEKNKLIYTLQSSTDPSSLKRFRLDPGTGVLLTAERLDHETKHQHVLTVMVRDQDVPVKRNYVRVIVNVEDTNDHPPWFTSSSYTGRVFESAAVDSAILQVTALDKDKGQNAEITYSIESGNAGNSFAVDPVLGIITVGRDLDRRTRRQYELVVKATDGGKAPMSATSAVHIFVTISDNAAPKFALKEYYTEINEGASMGTFVLLITASSQSSIVYEIKTGNTNGAFKINPNSGVIITQNPLDNEGQALYRLTVEATNMAGLSTNVTVLIQLQDENDNMPVFMKSEYVGIISESAHVNSVVLNDQNTPLVIQATDADEGSNALLVYQIAEPSAQKYFAIDSSTGAIRTIVKLDYEQKNLFNFTVQVHDSGRPQLFAEHAANVSIRVIDVNDCPPVFVQHLHDVSLLVPTYKGVKVTVVNATDPDSASNADLIYSIIDGNIGEKFSINTKTALISVQNTTHLRSRYELTVRASDGKFSCTTSVRINIKESESHLKFTQSSYSAVVKENSTEVKTIAIITTMGNEMNEPLFYHILNPDRKFKISRTSGVLVTTGLPFDREEQETFDVVIEVSEEKNPSRVAHVVVKVTVEDVNDNAPIFVNLPYYAVVQVDAEVGHVIRQVTAIDKDTGKNSEVYYHFKEHHEHFQIDPSGEISLKKTFEPSLSNMEYIIAVIAKDGGDVSLSAEVEVPITVINKAMPVFEKPFYSIEIPENIQLHTPVVHVQANSPEGPRVIYSISDGDPFNQFTINFNTGVINVISALDFETHPAYKLTIRATDSLTGSYSEVFVDIVVEDVNDNSPVFAERKYTATLSEASVVGTSVVQVSAADLDSGINKVLYYQLVEDESKSSEYFHIDSTSGLVLTARMLDYEHIKQYDLLVRALDNGKPQLSSDIIVTLHVTDLNDNPPLFNELLYRASVSEPLTRGLFVTHVQASDADASDVEKLRYSIVSGNDRMNFAIDSKLGIITIAHLPNQNLEMSYNLGVSVSDGVFRSSAKVLVNVLNANFHDPVFEQIDYEVELAENSEIGTLLIEVKATDKDSGTYGHVDYSIVNDFARDKFSVDQKGNIFTSEKLDRENPMEKVITISVMAKDGGGKVAFCNVNVILTDENDNVPQFRAAEYKVNIGSNAPKGSSVIRIVASDADEGSNADIVYAIEAASDNVEENLQINSFTGIISTKESLVGLENNFYTFFVRARDGGIPQQDSVVSVYVRILQPEIHLPVFPEPFYTFAVSEEISIGTEIDLIRAESDQPLIYSLVEGKTPESNMDKIFAIERDTGRLKTEKSLDHETTKWYQITVLAQYHFEEYEVISSVDVSIQVKDENDNKPIFDSNPYKAIVVENLPEGTLVIQVKASDLDSGVNGLVTYSLAQSQDLDYVLDLFTINGETGWITTLKELDHEKRKKYSIMLVASDHGEKLQLSSSTVVDVTVIDVNDNPPRFTAEVYKGTVSEDDPPGGVIAILSTTDADTEEVNRQITCYITGGDPLGQFAIEHIHNEWKVYVRKPLDREKKDHYLLNITATDGTLTAKAVVEVKVLDANDNNPICEKTLYTETITEDVPSAKLILVVMAEDADIRSNGEITYTLHGTGAEKFRLDSVTGELKTLAPLDREQQAVYNLFVKANDGGGRFCQADIVIALEDVNDNAPVFSSDQYTVSVFENTANKTLLTRIQATDPDAGLNRKVLYSLADSADDHFSIDELSGIISLEKLLDRELQASYSLTVKATDQGALRKLSSVCTVLVSVLDINDNPPVFEHREYLATLPENIPLGTEVLEVFAASKDIEANGEITYSIISGNEYGKFSIDPRTGAIFVLSSLDFETSHEYYLTVEVTDGGTPSLNDVATVNINVTDINDNAPKFSHGVYMAVISEDAPLGQLVVTVIADDSDGPSNNQIHYSIINGNQGSPFTIDNIKGEIKVAQHLDREKISGYTLTVQASDNGSPSQFNTTTVNIDVADVNDNPPIFSQANYSIIIQENKPIGSSVLQLQVIDKDSSHNGPPFTFMIIGGNDGNEFQINPQGLIFSSSQLDHKIKDVYLLQVKVTDNGRPPLSSSTFIKLKIIEESIYPPAILPLEIHITTVGDEYAGGVIGKIHATDQDIYDTLRYSLASDMGNLFAVSSNDGKMIAHKLLDVGQYILNVTVTDGRFTTAADVTVHVKQVTENQVNHSIAIKFANITPEEFIGDYWRNFQRALRNILGIRRHDIHVVSLQPSEPPSNLDVLLTVNKASNSFHQSEVLFHKLNNSLMDMEEMMGVRILKVIHKLCAGLDCPFQFCDEKITIDSNAMSTHTTARLSFVTPRHHRTAVCLCKGSECPTVHKLCESNLCPADAECVPDVKEERYMCLCRKGNRGQCSGGTSLSFNGNSYVKYRLLENENKEEMKLSLRLRTYHPYAFVMYARGTDYSILEINNGRLQYKFDCGSGPGTVSVQSIQVNDGEWHSVSLEVDGNYARLVLDRVHTAAGTAPGTLRTLNLDNFLYFGGQIRQQHTEHSRNTQVRNGFRGCLESVTLNGKELPLNSKPRVHAVMEESVEISSGCSLMLPEGCSSSPCLNSGTCSSLPNGDYFCKCTSLFTGIHCEIGVSPCASNPCLYGGTCIPVNNNYICQCRGQYTGLRCEVGPYCKDNPCKNNGNCIDSLDGPVCECEAGYRGERCLADVDECHESPCLNKGQCVNTYGSFNCNCSHGFVGNLCADTVVNKYVSTPWNIGLEEVIGIIVFVATIFILVLFFVFFRKKICKKKLHNDATEKRIGPTTSFLQKNYFDSKINKTIYSDIPPQVPVRPISYTPSIPSDSRNNLDRNSFEGSAIPEHPEFSTFNPDSMHGHRKTVAVCSVAPNLPPPPPSNSPSDCDSIQKPSWDYDYDAKVVDLEPCPPKKALDDSACHSFNTRGSISEVQSLSSFQSESCDDNAYHWDTSDWMPNVQLPGIQEYPQYELTEHQAPLYSDPNAIDTDYYPGGYDIESDFPPPPDDFPIHEELPPLPPEYNEFDTIQPPRDMPTAASLNSTSQKRQHFNMNQYLPHHHYSERQNAVPAGSSYRGTYPSYSLTYNDDFEAPSMDNISMSVYTSTTASCSDVSACCELEEAEVIMSDYESGNEGHFDDVTIPPLDFQQHTEV